MSAQRGKIPLSRAGKTSFWQEIEQVEGIEDANDRTGGAYKAEVTALLNGFIKTHGSNWSKNDFNDDIAWAVIAYTRGYQATGDKRFLTIAQSNFDRMFARAQDPSAVLAVDDLVADQPFNSDRVAVVEGLAGANGQYLTRLRTLLSGIRKDNQATSSFRFRKSVNRIVGGDKKRFRTKLMGNS